MSTVVNDANTPNRWFYMSAYATAVKHGYKGTEEEWLQDVYGGAARADAKAEIATEMAETATEKALDSEAYGAGTRAGEAVTEDDPAYQNNAMYYAQASAGSATAAEGSAEDSEAYAVGKRGGTDVESDDPAYENNSKYYAGVAKDYADNIADPVSGIVTDWLGTHVDPDTGYVIDDTLLIEDAAADAKVTGEKIGELKSALKLVPHFDYNKLTQLTTATDYNDLTNPGDYVVATNAYAALMTNSPVPIGHRLIVSNSTAANRYFQLVIASDLSVYIRFYTAQGWGSWSKVALDSDISALSTSIASITAALAKVPHMNYSAVTSLTTATDYNNVTAGDYVIPNLTAVALMTNCPTTVAHRLFVFESIANNRYFQIVVDNNADIFIRNYTATGWSSWKKAATESYVDSVVGQAVSTASVLFASNDQIIDSCAAKYMQIAAGRIYGAATHKKLVVAHISDTHQDTPRITRFVNYVNDHDIVDFAIHTGDVDTAATYTGIVAGADKPVYLALGNHDGDSYANSGTFNSSVGAAYFTNAVKTKLGVTPTSHNCYYVDNSDYEATIRFIFINEYDYPDELKAEDMPSAANGFYNGIYSQEQINWLISVLDDCITNDYYAVICSHQKPARVTPNTLPFYQSTEGLQYPNKNYTGDIIGDIVHAYKNGATISETYNATYNVLPNITVSKTFSGQGKFICFIDGHNHGDFIGYSSTHADQLVLNGPFARATILANQLYSDLPRSLDMPSQDCYNVYIFDIENHCVHVVRIGSNMNYLGRMRKYYKYDF